MTLLEKAIGEFGQEALSSFTMGMAKGAFAKYYDEMPSEVKKGMAKLTKEEDIPPDPLKQLNEKLAILEEKLNGIATKLAEEDDDEEEVTVNDLEVTDELVERIKTERHLMTEDEAEAALAEAIEEHYGEGNEE